MIDEWFTYSMQTIKRGFIIVIALIFASCKSSTPGPFASDCYASIFYTVPEYQIPPQIMKIYRQKVGDSPVVRSQLCIAGNLLMYYALRFKRDSKLQEITISPDGKSILVYDAPEKADQGK